MSAMDRKTREDREAIWAGPLLGPARPGPRGVLDYRRRTSDTEICGPDGLVEARPPEPRPTTPRWSQPTCLVTLEDIATGRGWLGWRHRLDTAGDGLTAMMAAVSSVMRHAFRDTSVTEWDMCALMGVPYPHRIPPQSKRIPDWRDAARRRSARRRGPR